MIATEGERRVVENLKRKATQADKMFDSLLEHMKDALQIKRTEHNHNTETELPAWL